MQEMPLEFVHTMHFNPDETDRQGGIWPIHVGSNLAKEDYHAGPRMVPYYSLHFVKCGTIELIYDGRRVHLTGGDLYCLFPEHTYTYRIVPEGGPLQLGWIAVAGAQAPYLLSSVRLQEEEPYLRKLITRDFTLTFEQLLHCSSSPSAHHRLNRYTLLYRLFSHLLPGDLPVSIPSKPDQWIQDSKNYMETHYTEDITVQDVAEYIGIHRSYYSKMFTERVGTTPAHYLRQLKMDKSLHMLQQGHAILEIALSLGYSDTPSFSRAFRQYYGTAPTHYYK